MSPKSSKRSVAFAKIVARRNHERAKGRHHIARHFSDDQIRKIAEEAGVIDAATQEILLCKIEAATTWFFADIRLQDRPSSSACERQFKRIERKARELVKELGFESGDDPEDGLPFGPIRHRLEYHFGGTDGQKGEQELGRLGADLCRLRDGAAAERKAAEECKEKTRRRGDVALTDFFDELMRAYKDSGRRPGLSRHPITGEPGGPTFRYVRASIDILVANYPEIARLVPEQSDEALASRISHIKWPRKRRRIS